MITTLAQFKERAIFYPKGHIIPRRILECSIRKLSHQVKFGCDSWVLPVGTEGHIVACDVMGSGGDYLITLTGELNRILHNKGTRRINLRGSFRGGETCWIGNYKMPRDEWEMSIVRAVRDAQKGGA